MNRLRSFALFVCLFALTTFVRAQTESATVTGRVVDPSGAVIPKASVSLKNIDTGVTSQTETNNAGMYTFATVKPGRYLMHVERQGFQSVDVTGLTFYTQDQVARNFTLEVGSTAESVTVNGDDININTADAAVGTVIDRQFVENIPLNGRSFQPLILLSPGVVTSTPQGTDEGSFSVNGQRTDANYYTVDGVSANNQAGYWSGVGSAGMASNATATGTTQAILPVDALQEFRITTSTYMPEYGRQPGAQISFQSRSGTNTYHGDFYDYLRNTVFDANNWFNTYTTPEIARLPEHQNDFGGALGGPLSIPELFSGRERAFFLLAYEGLRLTQPQPAYVYYVPSNGTNNVATYADPQYKNLRLYSPAALQPVLNAFPLPNCTTLQNAQCVDYGDGLSPVLGSGTSPSSLNSFFVRADIQVKPWMRIFARYSDSTSTSISNSTSGPNLITDRARTRVFLLGLDSALSGSLANQLRLQYSPSSAIQSWVASPLGGAQPLNLNIPQGLPAVGGESKVELLFANGETSELYGVNFGSLQFQPNAVDTISWTHGTHLFKAGADYRQTTAYLNDGKLSRTPGAFYYYETAQQILENEPPVVDLFNYLRQDPTTKNLGLFFQDQWHTLPRLSLALGLRWDLNPPPSISGAQQYTYAGNISNPASMSLSKLGAPLYQTVYTDFQPRAGMSLMLHNRPGQETVLRAGGGLFYDTVSVFDVIGSDNSLGPGNRPYLGTDYKTPQPFPAPASLILAPIAPVAPPYTPLVVADPHTHPPSTIQWNVSVEQAFGLKRSLTLGYVGAVGRDLINYKEYSIAKLNPLFGTIIQFENGPGSNYNALQTQFKQQVLHGLQALASYTWSHSIDSDSTDYALLPVQRGNSDHDVRNNFTAAFVYASSSYFSNYWARAIASDWNLSLMAVIRSAFPVQVIGTDTLDAATGDYFPARLNYNGKYPYVHDAGIPGSRKFNPAVFSVPTTAENGDGDAPRNFMRGFGEGAADTAIQRQFHLKDQLNLLFRAEAFNVLNHPNFGTLNVACGTSTPGATCTNSLMGQATNTISSALVGASSIYQQGGPRSLQFALKLQF